MFLKFKLFAMPLSMVAACFVVFATSTDVAAQDASYSITIANGKFSPSTLTVKAGVKFTLTIKNAGSSAAEFESHELGREKVVPAGSSANVYLGPLAAGTYPFFDDFNQAATGQIVAK